jgi:hypothetical protein
MTTTEMLAEQKNGDGNKRESKGYEPLVVSVSTAADLIDRSTKTVHRYIKSGLLEAKSINGQLLVSYPSIKRMVGIEHQSAA